MFLSYSFHRSLFIFHFSVLYLVILLTRRRCYTYSRLFMPIIRVTVVIVKHRWTVILIAYLIIFALGLLRVRLVELVWFYVGHDRQEQTQHQTYDHGKDENYFVNEEGYCPLRAFTRHFFRE